MKIALFASLAMIVVGVLRCSGELTPVTEEIASIRVAPATIDVPEDVLPGRRRTPFAALATRLFAMALSEVSSVDVVLDDGVKTDAIAKLHLGSSLGSIEVGGVVTSCLSGRAVADIEANGPPRMLRATMVVAARKVAEELGVTGDRPEGRD